jgi:hypothetical protein
LLNHGLCAFQMVFGKWKKMDSKYLSSFTAIYIFECVLLPLKISNFYSYLCLDFYRTWLKIWATRRASFKKQELLTLCKHTSWTRVFFGGGGGCVSHVFSFLCCSIMCLYFLSSVLWCLLRFPYKTTFGSSTSSCL